MLDKVKQDLFTVPGIIVTLIHLCFVVGVSTCWIAFQTQVMGNDPLAAIQKTPGKTSGK